MALSQPLPAPTSFAAVSTTASPAACASPTPGLNPDLRDAGSGDASPVVGSVDVSPAHRIDGRDVSSLPRMRLHGQPVRPLRYLGKGATSQVWLCQVEEQPGSASGDPTGSCSGQELPVVTVVCKVFEREEAFDDERTTWQALRAREASLIHSAAATTDVRLQQLLVQPHLTFEGEYEAPPDSFLFGGALFFQPAGHRRSKSDDALLVDAQDVHDVFSCLEWLRALRVVHRAILPRHLVRHRGQLLLIDFGYAVLLDQRCCLRDDSDELEYEGSAFLTPNRVLARLAEGRTYHASFADDLESLVKLCFVTRYHAEKTRLYERGRRDHSKILGFWRRCEEHMNERVGTLGPQWTKALRLARDNQLEVTRDALVAIWSGRRS